MSSLVAETSVVIRAVLSPNLKSFSLSSFLRTSEISRAALAVPVITLTRICGVALRCVAFKLRVCFGSVEAASRHFPTWHAPACQAVSSQSSAAALHFALSRHCPFFPCSVRYSHVFVCFLEVPCDAFQRALLHSRVPSGP